MCRPAVVCVVLAAWACVCPAPASCGVYLNYRPVIGKSPFVQCVFVCYGCYIAMHYADNSSDGRFTNEPDLFLNHFSTVVR